MIVITGATGNIGGALMKMLVEANREVRALTRDVAKAKALLGSGVSYPGDPQSSVSLVEGDLSRPETLPRALEGAERAFFVAHAGPDLGQMGGHFAEAAQAAGVRHVVIVSSSTVAMVPPTTIGRWHLALEERVKATTVAWTMLRPGNFASNTLRWAHTIRAQGAVFAPNGDGKTAPIDPRDIAAVAFHALTGQGHEGKTYALTGSELVSTREQVEAIAKARGLPIRFVEVPEERARAGMLGAGMPELMADAVLELVRAAGRGDEATKTTTVRDVTGREARTFDDWVRDHVVAFS
jgi:uncharacterized protein YbjT (DUF2867 family)